MANTYKTLLRALSVILFALWAPMASAQIRLLEPIGGTDSLPTDGAPFSTFEAYFNLVYPWVVGTAAGIAVLWGIFGISGIIINAGDQSKRMEGVTKLKAAVIGLIVILLAGVILNTINPTFFKIS